MITWPYIAGFIDCDGCITKTKVHGRKKHGLQWRYTIVLVQSGNFYEEMQAICKFLQDNCIKNSFVNRPFAKSTLGTTHMINIVVGSQQSMYNLLEKILPYLLFKKQKAIDAKQYLEAHLQKRVPLKEAKKFTTRKNKWQFEEVQQLKKMYTQNHSYVSISNALKKNIPSIAQKLKRLRQNGELTL